MLLTAGVDVSCGGHCADANCKGNCAKKTPLMLAILQRNAGLSHRLLAAGAAVCMVHSNFSILPEAVFWGYYPLIQDIINACADINAPTRPGGDTALTVVVIRGEKVIIQLLIDAGADINGSPLDSAGKSPLVAAVRNSDLKTVQYLLALGADPNEISLLYAVSKSPELMQVLLTARLNRYQRFSQGFGCQTLQLAIASSNAVMIGVLLSNGVDPNTVIRSQYGSKMYHTNTIGDSSRESAFGAAIRLDRSKDQWMIHMLLRGGANPNRIAFEQPRSTALLVAVSQNSLKLVEILLAAGADLNPKLGGGMSRTLLQLAAEQGNIDFAEFMLEQGADVNAPPHDQYGATAPQLSAIKGYLGIALLLLEKGANINASPAKVGGRTVLEGAAEHGRIDMLQLLLKAGAQVTGLGSQQ